MKFIYVMDKKLKKKLVKAGYELLKEDDKNCIWIFANKEEACFELGEEGQYAFSDILSF